jgi:hypothetical protein
VKYVFKEMHRLTVGGFHVVPFLALEGEEKEEEEESPLLSRGRSSRAEGGSNRQLWKEQGLFQSILPWFMFEGSTCPAY